jgi:hypothetical protein
MMTLGELIYRLKRLPPDEPCALCSPHSYRGYYDQLAFELDSFRGTRTRTVKDALEEAESALGRTFEGYKGGEYVMKRDTPVWLSNYGEASGFMITELKISNDENRVEIITKSDGWHKDGAYTEIRFR